MTAAVVAERVVVVVMLPVVDGAVVLLYIDWTAPLALFFVAVAAAYIAAGECAVERGTDSNAEQSGSGFQVFHVGSPITSLQAYVFGVILVTE
jgi:uncharacterized membrane protein